MVQHRQHEASYHDFAAAPLAMAHEQLAQVDAVAEGIRKSKCAEISWPTCI